LRTCSERVRIDAAARQQPDASHPVTRIANERDRATAVRVRATVRKTVDYRAGRDSAMVDGLHTLADLRRYGRR
jgi:hypothetical protein